MGIKLNEAVGVPKGIVVAGEKLYDDFKRKVIPMLKDGQTEYKVNFKPNEPYTIGDEEINNVEIDLTLRPDSDKYGEANMQVYRKNTVGKIGSDYVLMKVNKNGTVILSIDKPVPEDWTIDEVIQSINKGKVQTVSALSHELKHEYDPVKYPVFTASGFVCVCSVWLLLYTPDGRWHEAGAGYCRNKLTCIIVLGLYMK